MRKIINIYLVFLVSLVAHNAFGYTAQDCIKCHVHDNSESRLKISLDEFKGSIHHQENIDCLECHSHVEDKTHQTLTVPWDVDCSSCHDQENRHGTNTATEPKPQCYSCHTKHSIRAIDDVSSSVHQTQLGKTCMTCHPVESGKTGFLSFLPSFQIASHNKQDFSLSYKMTNCIGCHQGKASHGNDGEIDDQNCYTCHLLENGQSALWGYAHPNADLKKQPDVFAAAIFYMIFIGVLLCGGFGLYFKKAGLK